MYGLEMLEGMNNKEMRRYHREQRRKKDAIRQAIREGLIEYGEHSDGLLHALYDKIETLDLENKEATIIIEYIMPNKNKVDTKAVREAFKIIADYCKVINNQETVLLTEQPIKFELY